MTPEFSRTIAVDAIGTAPRSEVIEASADERAALARRFGLKALDRLTAEAVLIAGANAIEARGRLHARVIQGCVVSGEPVPATLDTRFELRFVAPTAFDVAAEEVELSDSDCDVVAHDGNSLDLGEAVAQTLALALDPFPRASKDDGAEAQRWSFGADASPFAGLKALLDRP